MSTPPPTADAGPEPALRDILPRPLDRKVTHVMVLACVVLIVCNYFGNYRRAGLAVRRALAWVQLDRPTQRLASLRADTGRPSEDGSPDAEGPGSLRLRALAALSAVERRAAAVFEDPHRGRLWQLHFWVAVHVLAYAVLPAVWIRAVFRERLSDYGLKLGGWHRRAWIYAAGFGIVLPLVVLFGDTPGFQRAYPFYKAAGRSWFDFLGWELAYALQFLALEFFFRGVLIHGLKHRFGWYAVLIMTVPYCMIHFGKPLPETLGAIVAGVFLGTLSMWTRSIWLGTAIHVSVALSMDVVALYYRGELGGLGWS